MWKIVLERSGFEDVLPYPSTDDEFDAAIGYILGKLFTQDGQTSPERSLILGDDECGAFLLPKISGLVDAWNRWKTRLAEPSNSKTGKNDRERGPSEFFYVFWWALRSIG